MKAEATHAWAAIGALNNPLAKINTAAETTMVDDSVGRMLDAINEQGLEEQTLIIYTADQGSAYGQHGLWGNTSWARPFPAFESHFRILLIVRQPRTVPGNQASKGLVSQIDLLPTILQHVGLSDIEIDNSSGRVINLRSSEARTPSRTTVYFEFATVRAIRTQARKYVQRFPHGRDELFFLRTDPGEKIRRARCRS